jgi:hypothetical protein
MSKARCVTRIVLSAFALRSRERLDEAQTGWLEAMICLEAELFRAQRGEVGV